MFTQWSPSFIVNKHPSDKSESREVQSLIEHARSLGLNIVSALIMAVTNGELDGELPSDYLDSLLVEATDEDEGDNDDLFNLIIGAVQDAFESLGVDETTIGQMFADDVESADAAIEAACEYEHDQTAKKQC
ncbi:hypothetical protein ACX1N5_15280 [Acinetobacter sp. ANC 4636]